LIYLILVRQFAGPIVWLSILVGFTGLIGGGVYLHFYQVDKYDDGSSTKKWIQYAAYACWVFAGIYALCVLCLYTSIQIAVAVMKTSAIFISQNMRTILVPFGAFIFTAAFVAFWVVDAAYLSSSGEIVAVTGGTQYRKLEWDNTLRYFAVYLFFALLWVAAMVIACTQYIIIVAVCVWYFTSTSDTRGSASIL
jgi:Plasma-membrane choline transporter